PPTSRRGRDCAATARPRARCAARSRAPTSVRPSAPRLSSLSLRVVFETGDERVSAAARAVLASGLRGHSPQPRDAALAAERFGAVRHLRSVRAARQGHSYRLEEILALESETCAQRLKRGFEPFSAPLGKRREFVRERAAQAPRRLARQHARGLR